jgi:hypothetical protein
MQYYHCLNGITTTQFNLSALDDRMTQCKHTKVKAGLYKTMILQLKHMDTKTIAFVLFLTT